MRMDCIALSLCFLRHLPRCCLRVMKESSLPGLSTHYAWEAGVVEAVGKLWEAAERPLEAPLLLEAPLPEFWKSWQQEGTGLG